MPTPASTFSRYRDLNPHCKALLREASVTLGLASVAVALLPFQRAIRIGTVPLGHRRKGGSPAEVRWAIEATAPRLPWRTMCIEQAIAGQRMLRRRCIDARLHYGARPDGGTAGLKAHVWLTVDDHIVIGAPGVEDFAELAVFPGE